MIIQEFFDKATFTLTYVVHKEGAQKAVVIDPVLDFDQAAGRIHEASVGLVLDYLKKNNLEPEVCLETHAHADHLSSSQILKNKFPDMQIMISERIVEVQKIFTKTFNMNTKTDGSQFDYLVKDNEKKNIAGFVVKEIPTPGHTPACSSYLIEDALFVGDTIFMPDYGVGRCDFPGGDAKNLYKSITMNIYTLSDETRIFVGHDYQPTGRCVKFQTTVGEQKASNVQLNGDISESDFVAKRESKDKSLNAPKLLLPSIQVNILAGHLPEPEENGVRYLKTPLSY